MGDRPGPVLDSIASGCAPPPRLNTAVYRPSQSCYLDSPITINMSSQAVRRNDTADILIVDDLPDNIRFLSNFLGEQGYQVRKALNGEMALRASQALPPDLILLDVNMPDLSGYEVCQELKKNSATAEIPVIFLSAGNEAIDKVKAFQSGGIDYITKPFQLEEVLVRIKTQLTIRQLQKNLEQQNQQLKQTLEELKIAQANLVQREKMSTLRDVVAGVAHEINNPLSFILCNIQPASDYVYQLLQIVEVYQQEYPEAPPAIAKLIEDLDLEFLSSDVQNILRSMKNGANRIHSVVLALRLFTRLDESDIKQVNIYESIESCLSILQHRLFSRIDNIMIQIEKNYGDVIPLTCHAAQLNLAIFNLINNAIDALEEKLKRAYDESFQPRLGIKVETEPDNILMICIEDNGIGIPREFQSRMFEPFFTTKTTGHGVGLNLVTSQRIIEELHRGQLSFQSQNGMTQFTIRLSLPTH